MTTSSSPSRSVSLSDDSVTKIRSQFGQRLSQIIFWVMLIAAVILTIQSIKPALDYYRLIADRDIGADSTWSTVYVWGVFALRNFIRLIFLSVGVLIYWRKPNERISVMTSVFLICFGSGGIHYTQYVPDTFEYMRANHLELALPLGTIGWILLYFYFMYFPDGRPVPRYALLLIIPAIPLNLAFLADQESALYPFNWHPLILVLILGFVFGIPLVAQIYRYRKVSTPLQRQQTKWVVFGFLCSILLLLTVGSLIGEEPTGTAKMMLLSAFGDGAFVLIPITLAIAMFRYRLWDVDLIINRSLAYVVVAGVALALFFGSLFGLQLIIGQTQPIVALLIAAGASALVFNPLHDRVQRFVDRRIYGFRFEVNALRQHHQRLPEITNPGALSGRTLGKYQILDVVGKGGMGEVYKASDGTRTYAIKTLLAGSSSNPELVSRFKREGEIGQRLNHPNIAGVYDIEQDENTGTLYLVMDYLDGDDLSTVLKRDEHLSLATTAHIVTDLAAALDAAHAQGLVHRDVKPSNVMLVESNNGDAPHALLMDFGITKLKDAHTLTGTGAIGTIGYMAPEQILDARTVDIYADIYALGVMTYEMLIGELPFSGGAAQVLFAHIQQPPPDPRDKDSHIPRGVAKAILTALAKEPTERFPSAGAFAEAINAGMSG